MTGTFSLGGTDITTLIADKQDGLSTSISNPTTQAVILDGTTVRSLTQDSTLTMSVVGDSIALGVDDTVMARHTSVASAISGLATFGYVDTTVSGLAGDVYTKTETDGLLAPKATTTALTSGLALKQGTLSTGSITNPTTQLTMLDGNVVRSIARDDNLTMTLLSNRVYLGVNTSNIATTSALTSGLGSKQASLTFTSPAGGTPLNVGAIVKGLKVASPITLSEASNAITLGLDCVN